MPIIGKEWFTDVAKQQPMVLYEDISQGCERFVVPVYSNPRFFMDSSLFENFKYTSRIIDVAGQLACRSASPTFMCQCAGQCSTNCECSSGVFGEGGTVENMELLMWDTVRECNEYCNCALWCGNRVAQKGAMYPVEIFARDPWCGWGVRASVDIAFGTFIGEYAGELIDDEEAMDRHDSTFLFETKVGSETLTIDAKYSGNYTRFINHSCAPNVKVANISWDYDKIQLIHMCFFTDKAIRKGEELTIDYGEAWWANKKFPCLCKSSECRYQFGNDQRT
ncbi:SET domain-containing protein [Caenorhabditis elegans]|uniref:SET domain-containing protein n=1 Tax=Caenorhabditis elegans TaxID=6239 RepID=O17186_CAEEL|nr:SET domain-containing protein [Caenorhabditis elegans]CCD69863.2 SET domain-containing protein [Caenorhabditis elegans]